MRMFFPGSSGMSRTLGVMNPKASSDHAEIGTPIQAAHDEQGNVVSAGVAPDYAPKDQALALAAELAARNAELMRRLA